jgi:hypothetical protein
MSDVVAPDFAATHVERCRLLARNLDKSESRLRSFEFVVRQYALHYRVGLEEAKLALRPITLGAR